MFIKLTTKDTDNTFYVNIDKIRSFIANKKGGTIMYDDTDDPYYVEENPEYIFTHFNTEKAGN